MEQIVRWGILGTGVIAVKFAEGLKSLPGARLTAVGSRSKATADAFARDNGVPRAHASYSELVHDPEVDAVYIATPHTSHKDDAILCLAANKPVLCEKPFCLNATQAEAVINIARAKHLLVMEAMWTRFFPLMAELRKLIANGAIGNVRMLTADFGFHTDVGPTHRLLNPKLGGGALLDIGVYPISLGSMLFGPATRVSGLANFGETGVDEQCSMVLGYEGGKVGSLSATFRGNSFNEATLVGDRGRIRINRFWWKPESLSLIRDTHKDDFLEFPISGNGYQYQVVEFMHCMHNGKTESPVMPLDETLSIMRTLDQLRAEWGLRYPGE
jgi:predicted dehydrogenase